MRENARQKRRSELSSGMLDSADSPAISSLPTAFPAWARAQNPPDTDAEAGFLAGAALARLDALVREGPSWAGVWRQRLALRAAAASVLRSGRNEDEAALRDAFHLTRPGADPGPAGRRHIAWRALTANSLSQWRPAIARVAEVLEMPRDEALQTAVEAAEACASGNRLPPFAAARAYHLARRALMPSTGGAGEGELLATGLADIVLALKLKWPFAAPLLAEPLFSAGGRRLGGDQTEAAETARVQFAYAQAAARACDLAAELQRRTRALVEAAPKLRAKGAKAALQALLDEDSLSSATNIPGLSERGARRLFDRLVSLGAVRELTGRATFRLYGL